MTPDLTILGKVIGGGLPAAAYAGRARADGQVAPAGDVYQAGTLSGNPLAVGRRAGDAGAARRRAPTRGSTDHRALADGLAAAAAAAACPSRCRARPACSPCSSPTSRCATTRTRSCDATATPPSAARCSSAASTRRRRSTRPGSRRSPTTTTQIERTLDRRPRGVRGGRVSALRERGRRRGPGAAPVRRRRPPARALRRRADAAAASCSRRSTRATCSTTASRARSPGMDDDLRLLAGDALYALGLTRLAETGDLEAVAELADLISLCAQAQAESRPRARGQHFGRPPPAALAHGAGLRAPSSARSRSAAPGS